MVELKKAKGDTLEFQMVRIMNSVTIAYFFLRKLLKLALANHCKLSKHLWSRSKSSLFTQPAYQIYSTMQQFYRTLSTQLKDVVWKCDGETEDNTAAAWSSSLFSFVHSWPMVTDGRRWLRKSVLQASSFVHFLMDRLRWDNGREACCGRAYGFIN